MAAEPPVRPLRVRCRPIADADRDAVLDLLAKSPFGRPRDFWVHSLDRLAQHRAPPGFPKWGYLLEVNGVVAGVLLLVSSTVLVNGAPRVRANVSSWYVWPAFRAYASLLVAQAMRHKEATYIDISPLSHTLGVLDAQGFERYCDGRFTAIPALKPGPRGVRVALAGPGLEPGPDLPAEEVELLLAHAGYDCISLVATHDGRRHPFVFEPMRRYRVMRLGYLVYCRSVETFVRLAGPVGRFLLRRGLPFVLIDANGPVPGLVGWYGEATPRYFKGPDRPRLGDLAYSERAVLGLRFPPRVAPED